MNKFYPIVLIQLLLNVSLTYHDLIFVAISGISHFKLKKGKPSGNKA